MRKVHLVLFLALASPLLGDDYRFSAGSFDERRGIVAFNQKLGDKLYLVLNDLKHNSRKQIEIRGKSSTPTVCGEAVAICSYGDGKIVLFDYELRPVSEVVLGKGIIPMYSTYGSNGSFLYVYVTQFEDGASQPRKFIYRYQCNDGKLTLDGFSPVETVGNIVTYLDSVFVMNRDRCEKVTFAK